MRWESESVLITGAAGFIGGNLAARLVANGANVVCIERDSRPGNTLSALRVRDRVTTVTGDVTDLALMQRVFASYDLTYVFHLAAQSALAAALREPLSTFESNIKGTWVTLEAARVTPTLKGVVVASSEKAYGVHATLPYSEKLPVLDRYPYGASKACTDILAQCYHATYGLPIAITRNANTYGPGDLNFSRLVPGAIRSGLSNETLTLRGNPRARYDYLYVADAVDAYLALAAGLGRGENVGEVFNFGSGAAHSAVDICNQLNRLTGSTAGVEIDAAPHADGAEQYLDITKAQSRLNWTPRKSLERGLERSVQWYREYLLSNGVRRDAPDKGDRGQYPDGGMEH